MSYEKEIRLNSLNWIDLINRSKLKPQSKHLALYLQTFMNSKCSMAFPSLSTIVSGTGYTKPTVIKHLKLLSGAGWLVIEQGSRETSNKYWVTFPTEIEQRVQVVNDIDQGSKGVLPGVVKELNQGSKGALPRVVKELYPNNQMNNQVNNQKEASAIADVSSTDVERPEANHVPYQKIVDLYHKHLSQLRSVRALSAARKAHIRARWGKELPTLEMWEKYFLYVSKSDFLMGLTMPGPNGRIWRADFDWLIKDSNVIKVSEKKYHT